MSHIPRAKSVLAMVAKAGAVQQANKVDQLCVAIMRETVVPK